ncbi:hypothetical protein OROMI_019200 [Orobanche minor]
MPNRYASRKKLLSSDLVESDEDSWSSWPSSTDSSSSHSSPTDSSSSRSSPDQKRKGEPNKQHHSRSVEKQGDPERKLLNYLDKRKWLTDDGKPIEYDVLKKYLKQVEESEGFNITDFPGAISGITKFFPFWSLTDKREEFPLEYDGLMNLAALATKNYNNKHQAEFKVVEIEKANTGSITFADRFYITFSTVDVSCRNYGKGSLLIALYDQFVNALRAVAQLIWLKLLISFTDKTISDEETLQTCGSFTQSLETPMQKLEDKLLRLRSAPECRADMDDLLDETLPRKIFQAVVVDGRKREVLSCRIAKCE